jgi:basic membrane protein A
MRSSRAVSILRRQFLAAPLAGAIRPFPAAAQPSPRIAALFAGRVDDHGFMEAGYRGLVAARDRLGVAITYRDGVKPDRPALEAALTGLAETSPALVIAHGGQNNDAAKAVAAAFPAIPFVVTQGGVTGPNLASYEVLQEQSAFLAGALAAWSTRTKIVGHVSGIRVAPGLKARAAYAAGIAHSDPDVRLLTNFCGSQDDNALSRKVALAMADAGADVIFTMLNAGRSGAIDACRERRVAQIGNVVDWVAVAPDVFIGSAIADSGRAVFAAAADFTGGKLRTGAIRSIGLEVPEAVRLTTGPNVSPEIVAHIAQLAGAVTAGTRAVPTVWSGAEFPTPA